MNIHNISALSEQLQSLGFENMGHAILKRICFKPDNFILSQKVVKIKDQLSFHLYFEKDAKNENYVLMYYDAILQKEMALSNSAINGIDIAGLEKMMTEIDWKLAFDFETKRNWNPEDKSSWEKEQEVELIIVELKKVETSEEGKSISTGLKLKFWAGIPYQELVGSISPLRNKSQVIQRFYLFDGQSGISVDEAYRFLQNKWLEKQMQLKRKQNDATDEAEESDSVQASSGNSSLLKKKRLNASKRINKKNSTLKKYAS